MLAHCVQHACMVPPLTSRASYPCQLGSDVLPAGPHMTQECLQREGRERDEEPTTTRSQRELCRIYGAFHSPKCSWKHAMCMIKLSLTSHVPSLACKAQDPSNRGRRCCFTDYVLLLPRSFSCSVSLVFTNSFSDPTLLLCHGSCICLLHASQGNMWGCTLASLLCGTHHLRECLVEVLEFNKYGSIFILFDNQYLIMD